MLWVFLALIPFVSLGEFFKFQNKKVSTRNLYLVFLLLDEKRCFLRSCLTGSVYRGQTFSTCTCYKMHKIRLELMLYFDVCVVLEQV